MCVYFLSFSFEFILRYPSCTQALQIIFFSSKATETPLIPCRTPDEIKSASRENRKNMTQFTLWARVNEISRFDNWKNDLLSHHELRDFKAWAVRSRDNLIAPHKASHFRLNSENRAVTLQTIIIFVIRTNMYKILHLNFFFLSNRKSINLDWNEIWMENLKLDIHRHYS